MKAAEISLIKESSQSFTFYHESKPFTRWHYHPEIELVLISKGEGKCMVGDFIGRFDENELVLLGSNLPHEWLCDKKFFEQADGFGGEAIVIQFKEDFLGDQFFKLQENRKLLKILTDASQGCFFGKEPTDKIGGILKQMLNMSSEERFYALFDIFKLIATTQDYKLLASPNFSKNFQPDQSNSLKKVVSYIMQNFHERILLKDMLELANMSSTTFSVVFKKNYNMTFSEYLLKVRIGFACSLLTDNTRSISQVANDAGFENLSNFNRLFKKAKGITPKDFKKKALESERYKEFY